MKTVFIDGHAGTTGLRIRQRLQMRTDLTILTLSGEDRKNPAKRAEALNDADIAFLCLPDAAAREAVAMVRSDRVVVLDTSTAHRTAPDFAYGFPELSLAHFRAIAGAKRIAVPGCHASGFIALIDPLIRGGLLSPDAPLVCHSITGYSGGGKAMIAQYEANASCAAQENTASAFSVEKIGDAANSQSPAAAGTETDALLCAPRQYGLGQHHKHLPEMMAVTGIKHAPAFCPVVADFYSGMEVTVPLFSSFLCPGKTAADVRRAYAAQYSGNIVTYRDGTDENGFLSAAKWSGSDHMEISLSGSDDILLPVARYDNLGKGASGAAVECMNIVLGLDPTTGLELPV